MKRNADYSTRREALVEFCTSSLENGFNARLRGGVIMQIANPAIRSLSSNVASTVVEGIANLFDDTQGQLYSASGDTDESFAAKIELALYRLFNRKQNPVEEVVEEEVVAEEVVERNENVFKNVIEKKENVIQKKAKVPIKIQRKLEANDNLLSLTSEGGV